MGEKYFLIILLLIIGLVPSCKDGCNVCNIQEIEGLIGNNSILAFETKCGATARNRISILWKKDGLDLKEKRGDVFEASNGERIRIEKISDDTVNVYYFAWDVEVKKESSRGITFIYKGRGLEFFKEY